MSPPACHLHRKWPTELENSAPTVLLRFFELRRIQRGPTWRWRLPLLAPSNLPPPIRSTASRGVVCPLARRDYQKWPTEIESGSGHALRVTRNPRRPKIFSSQIRGLRITASWSRRRRGVAGAGEREAGAFGKEGRAGSGGVDGVDSAIDGAIAVEEEEAGGGIV